MGSDGSRVIEVDNIFEKLSECKMIEMKSKIESSLGCSVYGTVNYVQYGDKLFYLGESLSDQPPHPMSLHYLIPPNLLLIS